MRIQPGVALLAVLLCACADQQALKQTASGHPEGVFANTTVAEARSRIVEGCTQAGMLVQESNDLQITCGKTMEGMSGALTQLAIGNAYSTPPEQKVRFVIFQMGTSAKVTADQWVETQMAFGQVRKQELNGNKQRGDLQDFLYSLGAD